MIYYDPQGDWIFHEQGVALVLDLYRVGEPYANIIVKRYRESDEICHCDDCMSKIPDGLTGIPFSKTCFLDYLERNPPGRKRPRVEIKKQPRFASAQIPKLVGQYLAAATNPSMDGLVRHIKKLDLNITRDTLRDEYRKQRPSLRPGRPSK